MKEIFELNDSMIETIKMFINDHYGWKYDGKCLLQLIEYYENKIKNLTPNEPDLTKLADNSEEPRKQS